MGKRNPKRNRATKVNIIFDEDERREFLNGFSKRKVERKEKAQAKIDKKLKEAKRAQKAKVKEERNSDLQFYGQGIPEIEHLIERPEVFEVEDTVVTITPMDTFGIACNSGFVLGSSGKKEDDEET